MIRNIYILLLLSLSFGTVTDIDGNVYEIVEVDEQLCMTDNLKGTHYIDDTEIPNLVNRSTDSYGVYNNDPINAEIYGNLYNGYQVNEVICYDENPLSIEEYNDLKLQHNNVRDLIEIGYFLNRDIIQVPVVFHNLYKIVDDMPINSYCDFISDNNYTTGNDQNLCNEMVLRTLEIINSQYANVGVEFVLHPYYPEMLHATDPGFDGFLENATGSNLPTSEDIKEHYNIPNAINIYTADCLGTGLTEACNSSVNGYSTSAWESGNPGIFIKHRAMPGSDIIWTGTRLITLAHELGHYFSLLHTQGYWFQTTASNRTPRELVSGEDCENRGDLICDTPGSPGDDNSSNWHIEYLGGGDYECVYTGYDGNYNSETGILQIGGTNDVSELSTDYNYCEYWEIENPFGLDHCESYTNYDDVGSFFGTKNIPPECFNADQSEYFTECHIDNYPHLPIGHNFMYSSALISSCGRMVGHPDNIDNNDIREGFTLEQIANMIYNIETNYTGCTDPYYQNYHPWFLNNDDSCGGETIFGCTDPNALNYNPDIILDDGTCEYSPCENPVCSTGAIHWTCPTTGQDYVPGGEQICNNFCDEPCITQCEYNGIGGFCGSYGTVPGLCECLQECTLGDVNCDGTINVIDIVMAVDLILNNNYNAVGDINGDGVLNVIDIVIIVDMVLNP